MSPWTDGLRTTAAEATRSWRRWRLNRGSRTFSQGPTTSMRWTGPEWICTQPGLPTKTMIGSAEAAADSRSGVGRGPAHGASEVGGEAHRLGAGDAEAAQEQDELVGVLLLGPGGAEARDVDLGVRAFVGDGDRLEGGGRRVGVGGFVGDAGERGGVGGGGCVDLVDGGAAGIEELQAPARAGAGVLVEEIAEAPLAGEEAEVDLAHHLAHGALEVGRVEAAGLLVDAGRVTGEGHDLAGLGQTREDGAEAFGRVGAAEPAGGPGAAAGLDECGLGDAEGGGGVAHAQRPAAGAEGGLAGEEAVGLGVEGAGFGHGAVPCGGRDRISDVGDAGEALELGMAEVERLVLAGVAVDRPELLGGGPGAEGGLVPPDRVRGVEGAGFGGGQRGAGGRKRSPASRRGGTSGRARPPRTPPRLRAPP